MFGQVAVKVRNEKEFEKVQKNDRKLSKESAIQNLKINNLKISEGTTENLRKPQRILINLKGSQDSVQSIK